MIRGRMVLVLMFLLSSCQTVQVSEGPIEQVNTSLDVMCFEVFDGELVIGTAEGVWCMDQAGDIKAYERTDQMTLIRDMVVWHDRLYIGGMEGVLVIEKGLDDRVMTFYGEGSLLPDPRVNVFEITDRDTLLIGTWQGLVEITDDGEVVKDIYSAHLLVPHVNIVESTGETMFVGSYNVRDGGLTLFDGGDVQHFDKKSAVATTDFTAALMMDELLYIGGGMYESGGLSTFRCLDEGWMLEQTFHVEHGLAGPKVRSLYLIGEQLYVGSEYDGMAVFELDEQGVLIGESAIYTVEDGLPNNEVKCMILYKGVLYIGTKGGIGRMIVI